MSLRLFFSHSSQQKLLVQTLRRHLPRDIDSWIDEEQLLIGDNLSRRLEETIRSDSDFLIIIVDEAAAKSPWVKQELKWAIQKEQLIGRPFVLPIVINKEAWETLAGDTHSETLYLSHTDFGESGVASLASKLASHLFAWLVRDIEKLRDPTHINKSLDMSLAVLDEADACLMQLANDIRTKVHTFHRANPLQLSDLFDELRRRKDLSGFVDGKFHQLIARLRSQGYLAGVAIDGDTIFVEEGHYSWKTTILSNEKERIADHSLSRICSGQTLILDGGSTTMKLARRMAMGLKQERWHHLRIVTNSVPVAHELMTVSSERGLEDRQDLFELYLPQGRVRLNTQAIVSDYLADPAIKIDRALQDLLASLRGADIAFVGTNGIYEGLGFTTRDRSEASTKATMIENAKCCLVLADFSKFGLKQEQVFARFDQEIEIITATTGESEHLVHRYLQLLNGTPTSVTVV